MVPKYLIRKNVHIFLNKNLKYFSSKWGEGESRVDLNHLYSLSVNVLAQSDFKTIQNVATAPVPNYWISLKKNVRRYGFFF